MAERLLYSAGVKIRDMNQKKYLDWRFRWTTWLTLLVAAVCLVCDSYLPGSYGDKNSPVETVQMLVLVVGMCVALSAKDRRCLYFFVAMALFLVLAREVNYGRTLIIFADPDDANKFPKWTEMKYGWLAHVIVGLYIVWLVVYFIWHRLWREVRELLKSLRMPACDVVLVILGAAVAVGYETMHDCLAEELGELVCYTGGVGILYLYSRHKLLKR